MKISKPTDDILAKYQRDKERKYILSWSGGKDSTAIAILCHEFNLPLDYIIFSEVMFDEMTSGENPEHIRWVRDTAVPLLESWFGKGRVLILHTSAWKTYKSAVTRVKTHGRNPGEMWGWPMPDSCIINAELKIPPLREFKRKYPNRIEYIGYAVGEERRLARHLEKGQDVAREAYPLIDFSITEPGARELCAEYGLLSPIYNSTSRGGCWFCPNARLQEQARIKRDYPELWSKLEWVAQFLAGYPDAQQREYVKRFCWGKTFDERNAEIDAYLADRSDDLFPAERMN